ncbi:elongation factor 1-delta-like isoform X2 [Atheta coriaria]|uniref:elongation factor 1-delta-like isoform X2 n=1 Tax=Dalotia coriaria TaxID=877792 RepID=UPI0031F3B301
MAAQYLALDSFWVDRSNYTEAERTFYERLGHETLTPLVAEFVKARETIKELKRQANEAADALGDGLPIKENKTDNNAGEPIQTPEVKKEEVIKDSSSQSQVVCELPEVVPQVEPPTIDKIEVTSKPDVGCNITPTAMDCEPVKFLEKKMLAITDMMAKIQSQLEAMDTRLSNMEKTVGCPKQGTCPAKIAVCPAKTCAKPAAKPAAADDDDDDVDLFGSESEDDEAAAKIKEERLAAYNAKKSKKPALVAKSSIILDVKPWDDETDMQEMEKVVRKIECDGLLWGASKLVPLAYGIKKLQINCVVEDDKVSIDWLQETIEANEDYVQSVDIAAFNKI